VARDSLAAEAEWNARDGALVASAIATASIQTPK
jgi:hypothetical protein